MKDWKQKDNKVKELLVKVIEEGPISHLLTCETANQMWNKLLIVYEQKSEVSLHVLQQKFFYYKYEGEEVSVHVSRLEDIVNRLKQAGENISNQMLITKVLMSLLTEFKYFISVPSQNQTFNDLISRLLIEEKRMENEKLSECPDENCALASKTLKMCTNCKKFGHIKEECFRNRNQNKLCHFCKKPGHFIKYCRIRKSKENGRNNEEWKMR
ncbi:hypothetical protein JTB14_007376 [Gonioctena quinquepunctata]|nr:hypothetical protein JTB14_007376 [Gonioctena quinquepunctata]